MKASPLVLVRPRGYIVNLVIVAVLAAGFVLALRAYAQGSYNKPAGSGKYYNKHYDWQHGDYPPNTVRGEAVDEARAGITLNRTPVSIRTPECFPAEPRDVFWQMDMVAGPGGKLQPLNFDE